jgi:hypothetical protein
MDTVFKIQQAKALALASPHQSPSVVEAYRQQRRQPSHKSGAATQTILTNARLPNLNYSNLFSRLDRLNARLDAAEQAMPAGARRDTRNTNYRRQLRRQSPQATAQAAVTTTEHVIAFMNAVDGGGDDRASADAGRLAHLNLQAYILSLDVLRTDTLRRERTAQLQHEVLRGRALSRGRTRKAWLPKGGWLRLLIQGVSVAGLTLSGTLVLSAAGKTALLGMMSAGMRDALKASLLPLALEVVGTGFVLLDGMHQPLNMTLKELNEKGVRVASILLPMLVIGPAGSPLMAVLLQASVSTTLTLSGRLMNYVVDVLVPYELTGEELVRYTAEQAMLHDREQLKQWEALLADVRLLRRIGSHPTRLQQAYIWAARHGSSGLRRAHELVDGVPTLVISLAVGLTVSAVILTQMANSIWGEMSQMVLDKITSSALRLMKTQLSHMALRFATAQVLNMVFFTLTWAGTRSAHAVGIDTALAGAGASLDHQLASVLGTEVSVAAAGALVAHTFYIQMQSATATAATTGIHALHKSGDLEHMRRAVWRVANTLDVAELHNLTDPAFLFPALMLQQTGVQVGDLLYRGKDARDAAYQVVADTQGQLYVTRPGGGDPLRTPLTEVVDASELHVDISLRHARLATQAEAAQPGIHLADAASGAHYRVTSQGGLVDLATRQVLFGRRPNLLVVVADGAQQDYVQAHRIPITLSMDSSRSSSADTTPLIGALRRLLPAAEEDDLQVVADACRQQPSLRAEITPLVRDLREALQSIDSVAQQQRQHMTALEDKYESMRQFLPTLQLPAETWASSTMGTADVYMRVQSMSLTGEDLVRELQTQGAVTATAVDKLSMALATDTAAQKTLLVALKPHGARRVSELLPATLRIVAQAQQARHNVLQAMEEGYTAHFAAQRAAMTARLESLAAEARELQVLQTQTLHKIAEEVRHATASTKNHPAPLHVNLAPATIPAQKATQRATQSVARGAVEPRTTPDLLKGRHTSYGEQPLQPPSAPTAGQDAAQARQAAAHAAEAQAAQRLAAQQRHLSQAEQGTLAAAWEQRNVLAATAALQGDQVTVQHLRKVIDMLQQLGGSKASVSSADVAQLARTLGHYAPKTDAFAFANVLKASPALCSKYSTSNVRVAMDGKGLQTSDGQPLSAADIEACFTHGLGGRVVEAALTLPGLLAGGMGFWLGTGWINSVITSSMGTGGTFSLSFLFANSLGRLRDACTQQQKSEQHSAILCQSVLLLSSVACGSATYRSAVALGAGGPNACVGAEHAMLYNSADLMQDLGSAILEFPEFVTQVHALSQSLGSDGIPSVSVLRGTFGALETLLANSALRGPALTIMFGSQMIGGGVRQQAEAWMASVTAPGGPGVRSSITDLGQALSTETIKMLGGSVSNYATRVYERPMSLVEDAGDIAAISARAAKTGVKYVGAGLQQAARAAHDAVLEPSTITQNVGDLFNTFQEIGGATKGISMSLLDTADNMLTIIRKSTRSILGFH